MAGLLVMMSNEELDAQEAEKLAQEQEALQVQFKSALTKLVMEQWQINKRAKEPVTERLLKCLRARQGKYDPDVLQKIQNEEGGSDIYLNITGMKERQGVAQIADIMLSPGTKPWGMEPTPIPELPKDIEALVDQEMAKGPQVNIDERKKGVKDKILKNRREAAMKASRAMEDQIEDQFAEGGFDDALMEFIEDFCTFPTAILKGPEYKYVKDLKWGPNNEPVLAKCIKVRDRRVSPFDIYPSPESTNPQEGRFIELIRYSRDELYNCIGMDGYEEEAIREVLRSTAHGRGQTWIDDDSHQRRSAEGKNDVLEQDRIITALQMWGGVPGVYLMDHGIDVPDPDREYEIVIEIIDGNVVMLRMNADPLGERPYYSSSYQKVPGSYWGISPPELMEDIQRMCNGSARALSNNMGMSSGPQVFVNIDRLPQGEPIPVLEPNHVWQVSDNPAIANSGGDPVKFYQPSSNAKELLVVLDNFGQKADVVTGIPTLNPAEQQMHGAPETAQGMAMRIEAMTKGIKQAIRNIDFDVTRKRVSRQYRDNMMYLPNDDIRGDMDVVARGATALIGKAATQARRNEFLKLVGSGIDGGLIDPVRKMKLIKQIADDMELSDIMPDEAEIEQTVKMTQKKPPADPKVQVEQMRMKGRLEDQKMENMNAEKDRLSRERIAQYNYLAKKDQLTAQERMLFQRLQAEMGKAAIKERGANERFIAERQIKQQYGSGI
jgi:hypothetical protein